VAGLAGISEPSTGPGRKSARPRNTARYDRVYEHMLAPERERLVQRSLRHDLEPVLLLTTLLAILVALAVLLGTSSPGF
jgi:hypothetical protein